MKSTINFTVVLILLLGLNLTAQTFSTDSKDGRNQAQFISDAPLEKIVGLVSGLDATIMINLNDITKNPMGKVKVEVNKIRTGIDLRDEHLRSESWLNAAKYPYVEFQLTGFKNLSSTKLTDGQKVQATAIGKFSLHGITKEIEVPVTLTYYKESERTKAKIPGNLLVTNAEFKIKLSDYGIKIPSMVVGKLNDEVLITANFVSSDANSSANPCGTCGPTKSEGKCNPCGVKKQDMKNNPCNPCAPKKNVKENPCNPCDPKKK